MCANGKCGHVQAGASYPTCCPAGTYVGSPDGITDYCYGMPNGYKCRTDAMCKSGLFCDDTCKPKKANNAACSGDDSHCQSGGCGFPERGAYGRVCCAHGTSAHGDSDYCKRMDVGKKCWTNAMCANGKCGHVQAGASTATCCPAGTYVGTYWLHDYCYGMTNGYKCHSNAMCNSNYCSGGICKTRKSIGNNAGFCHSNNDCRSSWCGQKNCGGSASNICCTRKQHWTGYCSGFRDECDLT